MSKTENIMNLKTAVLVSSCDFFDDCWEPFIYSIKKFWPDCDWPIYIISNKKSIQNCPENFHFIKTGEDRKFASNLKYAIQQINVEYIIYLQEDYFLNKQVDNKAINSHILYCSQNNVDYLRLGPPYLKGKIVNEIYRQNNLKIQYALCLQSAIWKAETLNRLLIEGWTGWDFEYKVQRYALNNNLDLNILSLRETYKDLGINYVTGTAVRKGKWTRSGYKFLSDSGFNNLINQRKTEGKLLYLLQEVHGILRIPCLVIVRLMKLMNLNF